MCLKTHCEVYVSCSGHVIYIAVVNQVTDLNCTESWGSDWHLMILGTLPQVSPHVQLQQVQMANSRSEDTMQLVNWLTMGAPPPHWSQGWLHIVAFIKDVPARGNIHVRIQTCVSLVVTLFFKHTRETYKTSYKDLPMCMTSMLASHLLVSSPRDRENEPVHASQITAPRSLSLSPSLSWADQISGFVAELWKQVRGPC